MKLLFYINTIGKGGAERVISNLANRFTRDGIEVVLVTSFPILEEYSIDKRIKRINLSSRYENDFFKRNIFWTNKMRKILLKENPDVAISFMAEPNFRLLTAGIGLEIKKIISIRNDPNKEYSGIVRKILAKVLFQKADGIVFQTNDAKSWFPNKIQNKSCIIMNQVNEELFDVAREEALYYVALGRIAPQKNYSLMIRGFADFLKIVPDQQLHIYGEGDPTQYVSLIKELGAGDNIHFMGRTDDVAKIFKNAKAFLMTSDYEGMPNALLEAMAVGLPCICTDCPCGGPRSVIENDFNGMLIPVGSKEKLTEILCQMNEKMCHYLGGNAKQSALQFHPEKVSDEWRTYIETIIKS